MTTDPSDARRFIKSLTAIALGGLLLRLVHLAAAVGSPLTYKIGPDEDYYLRFATSVAQGGAGMSPEFAFMDPLYGYVLGAVLWLSGGSVFPMYLLQIGVDTLTLVMLALIGKELGRPRAGLLAATAWALTATALMYSMTLLKATWVAAFISTWVWLGLRLVQRDGKPWQWVLMGLLCGLGVALRSNLVLVAVLGLLALPALAWRLRVASLPSAATRGLLLLAGLALPLSLLAWRNAELTGHATPIPTNGGVVLHHLYNPENPRAGVGLPAFVRYAHPSEIWRAYAQEAESREQHALSPREVDAYWRQEAVDYLRGHPGQTLGNWVRKSFEAAAAVEVPNNRHIQDEKRFLPTLRILPPPFPFLFALGLPGLLLMMWREPRSLLLAVPLLTGLATMVVFFPESRFRFGFLPVLAVGTGWMLDQLLRWRAESQWRPLTLAGIAVLGFAVLSFASSRLITLPGPNWQRMAWGYIHMGEPGKALQLVLEREAQAPDDPDLPMFHGFLALDAGQPAVAIHHLLRALETGPHRHEVFNNLSIALEQEGRLEEAINATARAVALNELPDYLVRLGDLHQKAGDTATAAEAYRHAIDRALAAGQLQQAAQIRDKLDRIGHSAIPPRQD